MLHLEFPTCQFSFDIHCFLEEMWKSFWVSYISTLFFLENFCSFCHSLIWNEYEWYEWRCLKTYLSVSNGCSHLWGRSANGFHSTQFYFNDRSECLIFEFIIIIYTNPCHLLCWRNPFNALSTRYKLNLAASEQFLKGR